MDKRNTRHSLPGQVMIIFAVGLISLVGIIALAVDVGYLLAERRQNQAAVDSAALSAAWSLLMNETADIVPTGKDYGARNSDVSENDVLVEWPATGSGPFSGNDYVRVTITKDVQKFFLGAVYSGDWQVTNTAVAGIDRVPKPYALVALNCPGIELNGSIQVNIAGNGSAISNCNISNSGNSSIFSVGGSIDAVGTIESNDGWTAPEGINPNSIAAPDPLAGAQVPPIPTVNRTAPSCSNNSTCIMEPGRYTNQTITIPSGATACMRPGTYYLDGNTRISFQSTKSTLTNKATHSLGSEGGPQCGTSSGVGGGVLIYIAPGSTAGITMGNGKLDITTSYPALSSPPAPPASPCDPAAAPYTNATCGMVLWIANGSTFDAGGNAIAKFEGVIYAPQSHVILQGTPGSNGLQVIVGRLELGGNSALNIEYRSYVNLDRPGVFLVE